MKSTNKEPYHDSVFQAFEEANQPLYDGSAEGISQLYIYIYVVSHILKAKSDYNMVKACVDEISQTFRDVLPKPNTMHASYYETNN